MKFKRMIAGFMTFVMAVAVFATPLAEYLPIKGDGLTASAASMSESEVKSKITALQGLFPAGSYFTVNGKSCGNALPDQRAKHGCSNCNLGNILTSNSKAKNTIVPSVCTGSRRSCYTCVAFARFAFCYIFGHDTNTNTTEISSASYGGVNDSFASALKPGDYLAFFNKSGVFSHAAIFLSADLSNNAIYVYDSNYGTSYTEATPLQKVFYNNKKVYSNYSKIVACRSNNYISTEPSSRFSVSIDNITSNNAVINFVAYKKTTESTKSFSIKVWETNNSSNSKSFSFNSSYPNVGKTQNTGLSFNLKDEVKFTMKHATNYSFTITSNYTDNGASKSYTSNVYTLTTTGSHSYGSWTTTTAATCTSAGTQKRSCSCGDVQTQSIPALGHNYTVTTVYPTETSQGYTLHTCSRCGDSYRDNYTDKLEVNVTNIEHFGLKGRAADALRLKWAKNSTVEGYDLYILDVDKQWTCIASLDADTTEYRISGLSPSTKYTFKIVGYRYSNGEYKYSPSDTIASYTTNPSIVKGNVLKGRAADALRLGWSKNASADGYILEQLIDGSWQRIAKLTKNTITEYRISGLAAGSVATFRIKSYNMVGKTALYSKYVTVKYRTNPTAVSALSLKGSASNAVRISWDINLSADGYIIEQKSGTKWVRVEKITKNSTAQFRKSGLKPNTSYTFRVKTYKMSGKTALYGAAKTITVKTK